MDLAVVQILLLSQEDCSLEEHTESFIGLVYLVSSDDDSLCVFFWAGLNVQTKAHLLGDDPQGTFIEYVDWVLRQCGSAILSVSGRKISLLRQFTPSWDHPVLCRVHALHRIRGDTHHSPSARANARNRARACNLIRPRNKACRLVWLGVWAGLYLCQWEY